MNLSQYAYLARRWILLALLPAVVACLLTYVYTARERKVYQATATLYVQQNSNPLGAPSNVDVQTSLALGPTYAPDDWLSSGRTGTGRTSTR